MSSNKKKFDVGLSRAVRKNILIGCLFAVCAGGSVYYYNSTQGIVDTYNSERSQAKSIQQQISQMEQSTADLQAVVDNSKQLVSFSDDKIKYITLASELSKKYNVKLNKLTVSDLWQEGQMSVMTTQVEIIGSLEDARSFVDEYCSTEYTNRINVVSMRQDEDFVWVSRGIDGKPILRWFNLEAEAAYWQDYYKEKELEKKLLAAQAGVSYTPTTPTTDNKKEPISMEELWETTPVKLFLEIDFLGRE